MMMTRRRAVAALALACFPCPALASPLPTVRVTKDPNCGCCSGWVKHLRAAGFVVDENNTAQLDAVKSRLGVPKDLWACHTAEVGRYVIEGHVPATAIQRLLRDQPDATGLAVPGMPVGAPGMEMEGSRPEEYTVFVFGRFGQKAYARYKASDELTN